MGLFKVLVLLQMVVLDLFLVDQTLAAPAVICPPNTVYRCLRICYSHCDNLNSTTEACVKPCWLGCDCIDGYVLSSASSNVCVPVSQCNVSCPPNMHFDPCTRSFRPTCATLSKKTVLLGYCLPRCVCNVGYVLSDDPIPRCIKTKDCIKPVEKCSGSLCKV